ncbi:MAG: hypothetical protein K5925_02540 [Bacilli bacterium]|nr:hypothetical protein [Bacilli bacterium]
MIKFNLTMTQKICLAGIFIPLVAIFQKIFAINYIAIVPFVRISFGGPALIIFASILLGPWFGLFVGAASDIVGFFIFDPKMFGSVPFFQITAIYALLGFSSYFVFNFVHRIKSTKWMLVTELSTMMLITVAITLFICLNNSIQLYGVVYEFDTLQRILIPILTVILQGLLFLAIYFIGGHFKKRDIKVSTYHISFSCFILEVFVMLIFGTLMKVWAFSSTTFLAIFFSQLIVLFINIPLNTFLLSYIINLSTKIFRVAPNA